MSNGKRENLSGDLLKSVQFHFRSYSKEDLASFRVERNKSDYPKAKSDLVIFDGHGTPIFKGREFGGGHTSLWDH